MKRALKVYDQFRRNNIDDHLLGTKKNESLTNKINM